MRRCCAVQRLGRASKRARSTSPDRPPRTPWRAVSFVPAGGAWPWDLEPSPDGRFLFVANYQSDEVVAFAIDPATGAPTTVVARVSVEKPTCVVAASPPR